MYKNFDENSNDSDEFNTIANATTDDDEDEEVRSKNKNGTKYQEESDQLKVLILKAFLFYSFAKNAIKLLILIKRYYAKKWKF